MLDLSHTTDVEKTRPGSEKLLSARVISVPI